MISLERYKKLLGDEAKGLTEKEIQAIYDAHYQFAELAFEMWAEEFLNKGRSDIMDMNPNNQKTCAK